MDSEQGGVSIEPKRSSKSSDYIIIPLLVNGKVGTDRITFWSIGFFVFVAITGWFVVMEKSDPLFTTAYLSSLISKFGNSIAEEPTRHASSIRATYIRGEEFTARFRAHVDCFSESGKWVYDPNPRPLPWNYAGDPYATTCDGVHLQSGKDNKWGPEADLIATNGGNWTVRDELKWVWQTNSSCPWYRFDRNDLCRRMGSRRNMLVVGDSINHETYWAFWNFLIMNTNHSMIKAMGSNTRTELGQYELCTDIFGPGNSLNISFVRNDRLSPVAMISCDTWGNFYDWPWLHLINELNIKVLFLNRGAHYEPDELFSHGLRNIFSILRDQFPHVLVLYRDTPPGHVDCMNYTGPLSQRQHDVQFMYNWEKFEVQNAIAKDIVEEYGNIFMDVDAMLSLRPDGHMGTKDCLHYCLPGPLDIFVEFVYNILLLL